MSEPEEKDAKFEEFMKYAYISTALMLALDTCSDNMLEQLVEGDARAISTLQGLAEELLKRRRAAEAAPMN